jgi:hypothetical protein
MLMIVFSEFLVPILQDTQPQKKHILVQSVA